MLQRTWKYGTRLKAKVVEVVPGSKPVRPSLTMLEVGGEAHLIAQVDHAIAPTVGAEVEMEFTAGGPTGGYWRIVA